MHTEPERKGQLVAIQDGTLTEAAARAMLERIRWPDSVHCLFLDCGGAEVYRLEVKGKTLKSGRVVHPRHLFKCKACRRQFSVTRGTIFEDSKIPLRTWILVMYRMCSSKKGVSAHQIHREFGVTYEAAWFMGHRIRYAMGEKGLRPIMTGTIEADETYIGGKARGAPAARSRRKERLGQASGITNKTIVFGLLERGGEARTIVVPNVKHATTQERMAQHIDFSKARLMTDGHSAYRRINRFLPHEYVDHETEYVRGDVHTQGIENYWSILKRGLVGTFHHVTPEYLPSYLQEFEYRFNRRKITDAERFADLLGRVEGRVDWYLGKNAASAS